MTDNSNGNGSNKYVTYKWLITILVTSIAGIVSISGAIANTAFYNKAEGTRMEARVDSLRETAQRIEKKLDSLIERTR